MKIGSSQATIDHLDRYLGKKEYDKALEAIKKELWKNPSQLNLRLRQAEILETLSENSESELPQIYNAVECTISTRDGNKRLVGEVQQHLGGGRVRCVALGATDGLTRGQDAKDTGSPVSVPVGDDILGRYFTLGARISI